MMRNNVFASLLVTFPVAAYSLSNGNPVQQFMSNVMGTKAQSPPSDPTATVLEKLDLSVPEPQTYYARPGQIPSLATASLPVSEMALKLTCLQTTHFLTSYNHAGSVSVGKRGFWQWIRS